MMPKKCRNEIFKNSHKGFSIFETAISILVIGIIVTFSMKGYNLIDHAKKNALINQITQCKIAVQMFETTEGRLPGIKQENDQDFFDEKLFWNELLSNQSFSYSLNHNNRPETSMGGEMVATYENDSIYVTIAGPNNSGILQPKDAKYIDKKIDTGNPSTGNISPIGENCTKNDKYNTSSNQKTCKLKINIY